MVNGPHSAEVLHQVVNLKDRRCVRQTASMLWAAGTEVPPVSDISFFSRLRIKGVSGKRRCKWLPITDDIRLNPNPPKDGV